MAAALGVVAEAANARLLQEVRATGSPVTVAYTTQTQGWTRRVSGPLCSGSSADF